MTWTRGRGGSCSELSPNGLYDGYMTWRVRRRGSARGARRSTMSSSQHNCNNLPGVVYMCATSPRIFQQAARRQSGRLLFGGVLLARFLTFEDGVLALHVRPAQPAVGQIPNDHWQLADLSDGDGEETDLNIFNKSREVEQQFCWC